MMERKPQMKNMRKPFWKIIEWFETFLIIKWFNNFIFFLIFDSFFKEANSIAQSYSDIFPLNPKIPTFFFLSCPKFKINSNVSLSDLLHIIIPDSLPGTFFVGWKLEVIKKFTLFSFFRFRNVSAAS